MYQEYSKVVRQEISCPSRSWLVTFLWQAKPVELGCAFVFSLHNVHVLIWEKTEFQTSTQCGVPSLPNFIELVKKARFERLSSWFFFCLKSMFFFRRIRGWKRSYFPLKFQADVLQQTTLLYCERGEMAWVQCRLRSGAEECKFSGARLDVLISSGCVLTTLPRSSQMVIGQYLTWRS